MLKRTFPAPEALRRFPFGLADIAIILGTLTLLTLVAIAFGAFCRRSGAFCRRSGASRRVT